MIDPAVFCCRAVRVQRVQTQHAPRPGDVNSLALAAQSGSVTSPLKGFNHRLLRFVPIIWSHKGKQNHPNFLFWGKFVIWVCLSETHLPVLPGPRTFQQTSHKPIPHLFRQENLLVQEHIFLSLLLNLCPSSHSGPHLIEGLFPVCLNT